MGLGGLGEGQLVFGGRGGGVRSSCCWAESDSCEKRWKE